MHCRNCGASLPDNARFCPECGQDQTATFPLEQRIQTPSVDVPTPPSAASSGFGAGFGAAVGWILGSCAVVFFLFVLTLGGCMFLGSLAQ